MLFRIRLSLGLEEGMLWATANKILYRSITRTHSIPCPAWESPCYLEFPFGPLFRGSYRSPSPGATHSPREQAQAAITRFARQVPGNGILGMWPTALWVP